jgi:hypothetical protein
MSADIPTPAERPMGHKLEKNQATMPKWQKT